MSHHTLLMLKDLSYILRAYASREFAHVKRTLRNITKIYLAGLKIGHIQHGS